MAGKRGRPKKETTELAKRPEAEGFIPKPKERIARIPNEIKLYLKQNKAHQVTATDIINIYRSIIFTKTLGQLEEMMEEGRRERLPVIVVTVVSSVLKDIASGNMNNLDIMLYRCFSKMDFEGALIGEEKLSGDRHIRESELARLEQELSLLTGNGIFLTDKMAAAPINVTGT